MGGSTKLSEPCRSPCASAGAAAASGRAQPLYPPGAELPPAACSGPPPPWQGRPGVPAARGQASADPSAQPPPRPSQESPARGACGPLATNHLRGLRGLCPGQLHAPGFTARAPGSRERGTWEAGVWTRQGRRGEERKAPRRAREESASHRPPGRSGRRRPPDGHCAKLHPARAWGGGDPFFFFNKNRF